MAGSEHQDARRRAAAESASRWLAGIDATEASTSLQRQLGLDWCSWITGKDARSADLLLAVRRIPAVNPLELTALGDEELLRFSNNLAAGEGLGWDESGAASLDQPWEAVLGTLAVSAARHGNLLLCAGLLRSSASLGLYAYSQAWAETFLLDQQSSCGSFGHLAPETAVVGPSTASVVTLTVNVLWSLAAVEHVVRQAGTQRVAASSSASLIMRSSSSTARVGQ